MKIVNVSNDEYRQKEGLSRSQLWKLFNQTPLHFKHTEENPQEPTPALEFGKACHKYILEQDDFFNEFFVLPKLDRRTKDGKEQYQRTLEENPNKTAVSFDEFEKIKAMKSAIMSDDIASRFLSSIVETEVSYFWTDAEFDLKLKVRPDAIVEVDGKKYIVDYKTTDNCATFAKSAKKYGYDFQSAMYREGVFQNELDEFGFVFIAQEKSEPYAVKVFECDESYIEQGFDKFMQALGLYKYCSDNGDWYGYSGHDKSIDMLFADDYGKE